MLEIFSKASVFAEIHASYRSFSRIVSIVVNLPSRVRPLTGSAVTKYAQDVKLRPSRIIFRDRALRVAALRPDHMGGTPHCLTFATSIYRYVVAKLQLGRTGGLVSTRFLPIERSIAHATFLTDIRIDVR